MSLRIYDFVIELVRAVQPVIQQVGEKDPNLADQLRRALTSVPLNMSEGAYAHGRNTRARFHTALGSAAEVRACIEIAEALGYVTAIDPVVHDGLDRVIATLYRLAKK